ncbi:MAG: hypothetical protein ACREFZ_11375, partial [Acetobacteraceae bacterium]
MRAHSLAEHIARGLGAGVASVPEMGIAASPIARLFKVAGLDAAGLAPELSGVPSGEGAGAVARSAGLSAGIGAASGAGQYAGQQIGGPVGGVIGGLAGGLAAGVGLGGAAALRSALRSGKDVGTLAPDASASDVAEHFTNRLESIDQAHAATENAARSRAVELLRRLRGGSAEEAGQAARGEIARRYEPARTVAQNAEGAARGVLDQRLSELGGEGGLTPGDIGQRLRQFVQEGKAEREAQADRLWALAQRNGGLQFNAAPVKEAAADTLNNLNPLGGDRLTPREAELHDLVSQWPGQVDFNTLKTLRSNVSDAINDARGNGRAMGRLMTLRSGIDDAIEKAVENRVGAEDAAISDGRLAPDASVRSGLEASAVGGPEARSGEPESA